MSYTDMNSIGQVTEVTGKATIIRTDGSTEPVTMGTEVFQGDIIETSGKSAVNVDFIDDSSFALSDNARVAMDEFVFDPETEAGAQDFSVMQGVFVYTSGLIGRENPDSVEIETPVGSIGIRGTIIGGKINPEGESKITVIEGAIVVQNDAGEQLLTNQFDTVLLGGKDIAPSEVKALDVKDVAESYGSVKGVSAELFSSFNDIMEQQGPAEGVNEDFTGEEAPVETKGESEGETDAGDKAIGLESKLKVKTEKAEDALEKLAEKENLDKVVDLKEQLQKLNELELTLDDVTISDKGVLLDNSILYGNRPQSLRSLSSDDFDPIAEISTDAKFQYEDLDGLIPIGEAGAIITRINVDDPLGETFSVNDFNIVDSVGYSHLLEIKEIDNNFYLKLADDVTFQNTSGPFFDFFVSGIAEGNSILLNTEIDTFARIALLDGDSGSTTSVSVGFADVFNVPDGGSLQTVSNEDVILGTSGTDRVELQNDNIQLLRGGDGVDKLFLDSGSSGTHFKFLSQSASPSESGDLNSIEDIFFNRDHDKLTIDIDNIITMLKTSDKIFDNQKEIVIHTEDKIGNKIYFADETGANIRLEDEGFIYIGEQTRGPFGDYQVFAHDALGTVAIESTISGAETGGL